MAPIQLTFLGTGTSQGVPMIACGCRVCTSGDPRDRRCRTSVLITLNGGFTILIDAAPELRVQCLEQHVSRVDAVLITHTHADHIFGLDDTRSFSQHNGQPLPLYAHPSHLDVLDRCFRYARADQYEVTLNRPRLQFIPITGPFELAGQTILPITQYHGDIISLGFRIGGLAYCTDFIELPPESLALLQNLDTLILGALRPRPHPTHINFARALELVTLLRPRRTYFTHLTHDVCHAETSLPDGVALAYDGLQISCP